MFVCVCAGDGLRAFGRRGGGDVRASRAAVGGGRSAGDDAGGIHHAHPTAGADASFNIHNIYIYMYMCIYI